MQDVQHDVAPTETGRCLNEGTKKEGLRVTDVVGGHGPWQLRHWAFFFIASFCTSIHLFSTLPLMSHTTCSCSNSTGNNGTYILTPSNCNVSNCDAIQNALDELSGPCFSPLPTSSLEIPDEDNLHCTNIAAVFYAKFLFAIGALISALATYPLLNRYGKRSVSLTSCFLLNACTVAGIWAFAAGPYLILKWVLSIGMISIYLTAAFSLSDSVSEEFRQLYFYTGHISWGLAHIILPLLTFIPSWTLYNIIITMPCCVLFILSCLQTETAESYAERGLWARAHTVMRKAARCNGYSLQRVEQFSPNLLLQEKEENTSRFTCKIENYRHTTERAALFLMGFLSSFVYFTSMWLTDWLQVKRGSYFSLLGTSEVTAVLVLLFFSYYIPFRRLWALTASLSSIFLIIMYARIKPAIPKFSSSTYLPQMFFSSTSWTLLLVYVLSQPLKSKDSKLTSIAIGLGLCFGLLGAALADIQKLIAWNKGVLLIISVPNFIISVIIGLIPSRFLDCLDI